MDKNIKIAGDYTAGEWLELKSSLEMDIDNEKLWEKAFEYFDKRLRSRYLQPIKAIENNSNIEGEGFSITAILCSLIEALEAFYQGKTYKRATKENPLDSDTEYFKSQPLLESFLTKREPFKQHFSQDGLAKEFYENVRCAVLHEAATRNGWKVRIDTDALVEKQGNQFVVNRAVFVQAIEEYMKRYKQELVHSIELKKAFIRKFDSICETA